MSLQPAPAAASDAGRSAQSTSSAKSAAQAGPDGHASDEAKALAEAAATGHRVEVVSERTETDTIWANPDGTLSASISTDPIRVKQGDDLVPVNLDLASSAGRLEPKAATTDVSFSATGLGDLATLDTPGDTDFGLRYAGVLGAPIVKDAAATYPIADATLGKVQVIANSSGFAANVVLSQAPVSAPVYSFKLETSGLTPKLVDGVLQLSNTSGTVVSQSLPLQMWDSRTDEGGDPAHPVEVTADLSKAVDGSDVLNLRPAMSYLTDPATVYPVTVDPTVFNVSKRSDSYVSQASPNTNTSGEYRVRVGSSDGSTANRIIEQFYMDKYMGVDITKATLNMYEYYSASCTAYQNYLYPMDNSSFPPSLTWNNQGTIKNDLRWRSAQAFNKGSSGCADGWVNLDVTPMLSAYAQAHLPNSRSESSGNRNVAAIQIRAHDETYATQDKRFCSMNPQGSGTNCTSSSTTPTLDLTYTPEIGDKDSYATVDHQLNDRTELKINTSDGNAMLRADDVKIQGLGVDLTASRFYNSLGDSSKPGMLGPKWQLSTGQDVYLEKRDEWRYDLHNDSGVVYGPYVRKDASSSNADYRKFLTPKAGAGADLKDNNDGTFTMTFHKSQKRMTFTKVDASSDNLYLTRTTDRAYHKDTGGTEYGGHVDVAYATGTHQASTVTDASGHQISFTYSGGLVSQITDSNGPTTRTWKYYYTGGKLTSYVDPDNKTTDYSWNGDTDPSMTTITDPANDSGSRPTATLSYPTNYGQATSVRYAASTSTSATVGYDFTYVTSGAGARCKSGDDFYTDVFSTDSTKGRTSYCFRNRANADTDRTQRVVDGSGNRRSSNYNLDDQPSSFTAGTGDGAEGSAAGSTLTTYGGGDLQDQLQKMTDPRDGGIGNSHSTSVTYDGSANYPGADYLPTSKVDSDGNCIRYKYDDNIDNGGGDRGLLTDSYDGLSDPCKASTGARHYHQEFTNDGLVKWSTDPNAPASPTASDQTTFTYWQPGDTGYVGGTKGMLKQKKLPYGDCSTGASRSLCTEYTYDGLGRIKTMTDGRGKTTAYSYDKFDRTTQVLVDGATSCSYSAGTCITYTYDAEGDMQTRVEKAGTTTFTYNRLNRQASVTTPDSTVVTYSYSDDGNLTQLAQTRSGASTDTVTYTYDEGNHPKTAVDANGTIDLGQNADNKDNYTRFPTSPAKVTVDRHYTEAGRFKDIDVNLAGASSDTLPLYAFSYKQGNNDTNHIQKLTISGSSSAINNTITYAYENGKNRLSKATYADTSDATYTYDDASNIKSEKIGTSTTYFGYDRAGQLCWKGSNDNGGGAGQLYTTCPSSAPGSNTALTRDGAGNNTGTTTTPLEYNAYNQVSKISTRDQGYNDLGNDLRTGTGAAGSGGATLVNSSVGVISRAASAGITYYTRSPSGKLLSSRGPGGTRYYVTDHQGSIVLVLKADGSRAGAYRYTPYGDATILEDDTSNTLANSPWRYVGGYYDVEGDGYAKLGARYYDSHGHFTQLDPQPGSCSEPATVNQYLYGQADPVNVTDSSGRFGCRADTIFGTAGTVGFILSFPVSGPVAAIGATLSGTSSGYFILDYIDDCTSIFPRPPYRYAPYAPGQAPASNYYK